MKNRASLEVYREKSEKTRKTKKADVTESDGSTIVEKEGTKVAKRRGRSKKAE